MSTVPATNRALLMLLGSAISACGAGTTTSPIDQPGAALDASADTSTTEGGTSDTDASAAPATDAGDADSGCPNSRPDGDGGCLPPTIRRPFLVGASLRAAEASERDDWSALGVATAPHGLDAKTAHLLAETWLKDALEEHASVAAFARFTMHLLSVGAPPELLLMAQRAGIDEIAHARACFALAARYGGKRRGPTPLRVHDAMSGSGLAQIAELAAEEGCVGETLGAVLAREQLAVVTDAGAKKVLRKIAADEVRHAELSWRFVRWAVRNGDRTVAASVRRGIARAITGTLAAEERRYDVDHEAWRAHGRLTCRASKEVARQAIEEVVMPCAERTIG